MENNLGGIISSLIMPCILIYGLFILKRKNAETSWDESVWITNENNFVILYAGILLSAFLLFAVIMGWTKG